MKLRHTTIFSQWNTYNTSSFQQNFTIYHNFKNNTIQTTYIQFCFCVPHMLILISLVLPFFQHLSRFHCLSVTFIFVNKWWKCDFDNVLVLHTEMQQKTEINEIYFSKWKQWFFLWSIGYWVYEWHKFFLSNIK